MVEVDCSIGLDGSPRAAQAALAAQIQSATRRIEAMAENEPMRPLHRSASRWRRGALETSGGSAKAGVALAAKGRSGHLVSECGGPRRLMRRQRPLVAKTETMWVEFVDSCRDGARRATHAQDRGEERRPRGLKLW